MSARLKIMTEVNNEMTEIKVGQLWQARNLEHVNWHKSCLIRVDEIDSDRVYTTYLMSNINSNIGRKGNMPSYIRDWSNWRLYQQHFGMYCYKCNYFYEGQKNMLYPNLNMYFLCWKCSI